uniref:Achalasia, adrenocortical insufficiency, alacrimia n=1 Tax=Hucho hucho TaxID=62062 RepID=A0A4W5M562_9TELE
VTSIRDHSFHLVSLSWKEQVFLIILYTECNNFFSSGLGSYIALLVQPDPVVAPCVSGRNCAVRSFAWHPHTEKCAVSLLDDSIKIYNPKSATTPTLKHRLQRSVTALQWKPLCASVLAVACHNCLLVWHVDPTSLSTRPSSGCTQVLSHPGHSPVTSMAWSPNGSLLVSASPRDTAMLVWDVGVERVTYQSWSPDGSRMLAATPSSLFRSERVCVCVFSGSWSPDGSRLLFSVQGETVIYALTFTDTPGMPLGMSGGPKAATVVADLSETTLNTPDEDMAVGREIQSLAWDPTGERLAVLLKGRPAMIAVFKTEINPAFKLLPCGFVQGEARTEPKLMQFNPNYQHGAQLTVVSLSTNAIFTFRGHQAFRCFPTVLVSLMMFLKSSPCSKVKEYTVLSLILYLAIISIQS